MRIDIRGLFLWTKKKLKKYYTKFVCIIKYMQNRSTKKKNASVLENCFFLVLLFYTWINIYYQSVSFIGCEWWIIAISGCSCSINKCFYVKEEIHLRCLAVSNFSIYCLNTKMNIFNTQTHDENVLFHAENVCVAKKWHALVNIVCTLRTVYVDVSNCNNYNFHAQLENCTIWVWFLFCLYQVLICGRRRKLNIRHSEWQTIITT